MNLEEAGEVILRGKPWSQCDGGCDGGWHYDEPGYRSPRECPNCGGSGVIEDPTHAEARRVLDIPEPERTPLQARKPRINPNRVIFPSFEIDKDQKLEAYNVAPISKILVEGWRQMTAQSDEDIIFDDD
jgi:hypothetical protein